MSQLVPIDDSSQRTACNNILFAEMAPTSGSYQTKSQTTVRTLYCKWADAVDFTSGMLGHCGSCSGDDPCNPEPDPDRPWLHCVECNLLNGVGAPVGGGGPISYEDVINSAPGYAMFQCTFAGLEYSVGTGDSMKDYIIKRKSYASETTTVPSSHFAWKGTNPPQPVTERRAIHQQLITVKYLQVMRPDPLPELFIQAFNSTINAAEIDGTYPSYTMLMMAPETRWYFDSAGHRCWDLGVTWIYRGGPMDANWLKMFKQGSGTGGGAFQEVVPDTFNVAQHEQIFVPCIDAEE